MRKVCPEWICAGRASTCPQGNAITLELPNFRIAIFHRPEGWFAVKDACPHAAYPLSRSPVAGDVVTCANHNWKFRLGTGECLRGEQGLTIRTFPVECRDAEIWVKVL